MRLSATTAVEPSTALTSLVDDLGIHICAWGRDGGVAEAMQRTMGMVRTRKYGSKRSQKSVGCSRTFSARRTVPGETGDDDEESAPIAGRPDTLSMGRTTAADVSTSPCA